MPITEMTLELSTSLPEAKERFFTEVEDWVHACVQSYRMEPPTNGKGQLTYTTAWEPILSTKQCTDAVEFLTQKRDEVAKHFRTNNLWWHGYWRRADVRHGTEHARLFLAFLNRIFPDDEATRDHILDAAEHVGNWVADAPAWYEPANGLYRSLELGTGLVNEISTGWNVPEHLNLAQLALVAYDAGGGQQYLDIAQQYAQQWANAILADERMPIGISMSGPFYDFCRQREQLYRNTLAAPGSVACDRDRAENLLANGAVEIFLRLWMMTGNEVFRRAVVAIFNQLLPQLAEPDAGALADAIRHYRNTTGDLRYDELVVATANSMDPFDIRSIGVQPNVMRLTNTSGVGKRSDMPVWFEDLHLRRHNPIFLSVAAEISGDGNLATVSLDLARTYFELARKTMRTGRQNGDAANTVAAVARGHGRDNGSGMVTSVFGSLSQSSPYSESIKYR